MSLSEHCEPFFQYICRLNRSARKGASIDMTSVRSEILALLDKLEKSASSRPELTTQFEKVKMPLIFFADYMIEESNLPFARDWHEIQRDYNEHAGDEKFFDLLDETLKDRSAAANERLAVFYTCIGLGFQGFYQGQPEYLRKTMTEISGRIRDQMDLDDRARITPEAYENVDTSNLVQPPGAKVLGIAIALFGLILVLMATSITLFMKSRAEIGESLQEIIGHVESPRTGTGGGS